MKVTLWAPFGLAALLLFASANVFSADLETTLIGRSWCFEDLDGDGTYGRLIFDIGNVGVSEIVGSNEKPQLVRWTLKDSILTIEYPDQKSSARIVIVRDRELAWYWLPPNYGISKVTACQ